MVLIYLCRWNKEEIIMSVNVNINGTWKEIGKDISLEDYQEYCQVQHEEYVDKVASKIGIDNFHFKVLDLERGADCDTLVLRFDSHGCLEDFLDECSVSHWGLSCRVLDVGLGLVKVSVF